MSIDNTWNIAPRATAIATVVALLTLTACFGRSGVDGLGLGGGAEGDVCRQDANCELGLTCVLGRCTLLEPADPSTPNPRPDVEPEECPGFAGFLELGEPAASTTFALPNRYAASCGGGVAPDEVWVLELAADATVRLTTAGSSFDTVVYVRDGCDDGEEWLCADAPGPEDEVVELPAGTWFVFVDGFRGFGDYELLVAEVEDDLPAATQ